MFERKWAAAVVATLMSTCLVASPAFARDGRRAQGGEGVVFVQTNEPSGNHIVVFDRGADGRLTRAASYSTGGKGGVAQPGSQSDHLASPNSGRELVQEYPSIDGYP